MPQHRAAGDWSFPAELSPLDETLQEYDRADQEWPDARKENNAHHLYHI